MQRCRFGARRWTLNIEFFTTGRENILLCPFAFICLFSKLMLRAAYCMLHVARCTLLVAFALAATFILFVAFCFAECEILIAKRAVSVFVSLSFFFWHESGHGEEEHMCPWVHYICDLPWKNMQKCVWCRRCGRSSAWNWSCSRKQLEKYAKSGWEAIHRGVQSEDVHARDARTRHRYYFKN